MSEQIVSNVEVTIVEDKSLSIIDIVNKFLTNKGLCVKLSTAQINILNIFIEHFPDIFSNITENIKLIIDDKVIDFSDLPHFVLLAKTITNTNIKELKALKITRRDVMDMIEALFIILIEMNVINTGNTKDTYIALLKASMQLLDASIDLDDTMSVSWNCCC